MGYEPVVRPTIRFSIVRELRRCGAAAENLTD
jgi:hypothetical protein